MTVMQKSAGSWGIDLARIKQTPAFEEEAAVPKLLVSHNQWDPKRTPRADGTALHLCPLEMHGLLLSGIIRETPASSQNG